MTTRPPADVETPVTDIDTLALVIELDAYERNPPALSRLNYEIVTDAITCLDVPRLTIDVDARGGGD